MIDVLDIIRDLQSKKKEKHIFPDHITLPEIQNRVQEELKNELNSLAKDGKIGFVKTINSKAFYLK